MQHPPNLTSSKYRRPLSGQFVNLADTSSKPMKNVAVSTTTLVTNVRGIKPARPYGRDRPKSALGWLRRIPLGWIKLQSISRLFLDRHFLHMLVRCWNHCTIPRMGRIRELQPVDNCVPMQRGDRH